MIGSLNTKQISLNNRIEDLNTLGGFIFPIE